MPRKKETLSRNEWLIMDALWHAGNPLALSEIIETLEGRVPWSYPTYQTQLDRLIKSGYVGFEKRGRNRFFYALVDMDACVLEEKESIREKMPPAASRHLLVAMLADQKALSPEEARVISRLIDSLEKEDARHDS